MVSKRQMKESKRKSFIQSFKVTILMFSTAHFVQKTLKTNLIPILHTAHLVSDSLSPISSQKRKERPSNHPNASNVPFHPCHASAKIQQEPDHPLPSSTRTKAPMQKQSSAHMELALSKERVQKTDASTLPSTDDMNKRMSNPRQHFTSLSLA